MIPGIPYFKKTILVCPLDWGLGHAARCVPLIKQLQAQQNKIIIGCTDWQKEFLQGEIEGAEYAPLLGYEVTYSDKVSLGLKMLWQFPRLSVVVRKEHAWLNVFLKQNKIDVVISDNRFGLYNEAAESVFITHQLFIPAPFLKSAVNRINASFINKFDACWVPDLEDANACLGGELAHGKDLPSHVQYIGPLSRFQNVGARGEKKYDALILLSGVEPQRSILEEKLTRALGETPLRVALVRGSQKSRKKYPANFSVFDIVNTAELQNLLLASEKIICRSGYSTLMDLHALHLKALLIPTPGQAEQEYLAEYWNKKFGFTYLTQDEISLEKLLKALALKENSPLQK